MVKKNVLTPVLAGVLGLSIIGSGVGYFLVNKDGGEASILGGKEEVKSSPRFAVMAENVSNTIEKAEKIAKGETDYACEADVNVSFGPALSEELEETPKDFGMKISSKQKGGKEGADIVFNYGGQQLLTVNESYSRDQDEVLFVKIPELSDAYIKVNRKDAEQYLKDDFGYDINSYADAAEDVDFDVQAFEDDLKTYEQTFKDNMPAVKDESKKSGDIEGVSYEYTAKSYEITGADVLKVSNAMLDKAKTDEQFRKLYDDSMAKAAEQMADRYALGSQETPPTYDEFIDQMKESVNSEMTGDSSKADFITYEDKDGELKGFELKPQGEEGIFKYVIVSDDKAEAMDMNFDSGDGEKFSLLGSMKSEDDAVNGSYTFNADADGEKMEFIYSVDDLAAAGDNFTGSVRVDFRVDNGYDPFSAWTEVSSTSDADNVNVVYDIGYNGQNAVKMTVNSKKTEASDVEMPGTDAKVYDALNDEEMNKYLEGCDVEGFNNKMKSVLGDKMYNDIMGGGYSGYDSYSEPETDGSKDSLDDIDWDALEKELEAMEDTTRSPA